MQSIPSHTIRQVLLMGLIFALFAVIFWNLSFFIPALLGAYTLYVLMRKPLEWLIDRRKWPKKIAAATLLLSSFILLLLLINGMISLVGKRVLTLFKNSETLLHNIEHVVRKIENQYGISLINPENTKTVSDWSVHQVQGVLSATVNGLALLLVVYFILWFMLTEGRKMEKSFFDWMPLQHENVSYVRKKLNNMVWGNALGIPLMGLVQGLAGLLIYWILEVPDPWLWFFITCIAGMMPLMGASLAYVPLALILLAEGAETKALVLFVYGFIVVGSIDNIARMWVLKAINETHPLITLFGVIVGLQLFGFIGFVFGPILIELFILLLQVYHKEFHPPWAGS